MATYSPYNFGGGAGYLDPIKGKAYPGSSGDWLTTPTAGAGGLIAPRLPGYGYPGDRSRAGLGVPTVDPALKDMNYIDGSSSKPSNNKMAELKAAYDRGEVPFEKLFEQYQLPSKYPEVSGITGKAFGDIAATDKAVGTLDFKALKDKFTGADAEMAKRYQDFQGSNDIAGYAAGQRASDAQAAALTDQYAATARGQLGEASAIGERYRNEGQGALDRYLGNAQDFYNKDIPAAIQDAQDRATAYSSRYGMARGGGYGSDIAKISGEAATRASLPYQLQGRQYVGEALGRYQPFYGDVAARDYARVAGLNMPTEQNIYGQKVGDVMRSKGTEQQLQALGMMVKERGLQGAIQNLRNQGLSESIINSLVGEWQAQKSRTLGLAGQAAQLEQSYGGERGYNYLPGSGPITQPQYYGLPSPNFPGNNPGRYPTVSPQIPGTVTGTTPPGVDPRIKQVMDYTAAHPGGGYGNSYIRPDPRYPPYIMAGGDQNYIEQPPYNPQAAWPQYDY